MCESAGYPRVLMRICHKCGNEKPPERFGKRKECLDCCIVAVRLYRKKNPEKRREHYRANKDRVLVQAAEYRQAHKAEERAARAAHYQRNKAHVARSAAAYRKANPQIYTEADARRRAAEKNAMPPWADRAAIRAFYADAARLTAETGIHHEVDHIVPIQGKTVCGLHVPANLQALTRTANRSKLNKLLG